MTTVFGMHWDVHGYGSIFSSIFSSIWNGTWLESNFVRVLRIYVPRARRDLGCQDPLCVLSLRDSTVLSLCYHCAITVRLTGSAYESWCKYFEVKIKKKMANTGERSNSGALNCVKTRNACWPISRAIVRIYWRPFSLMLAISRMIFWKYADGNSRYSDTWSQLRARQCET